MKGIELKEIRKEIGKTQTELADSLGVAMRTVQNWEKDVNKIPNTVSQVVLSMAGKSTDKVHNEDDEFTTMIITKLFDSETFKQKLLDYIKENATTIGEEEAIKYEAYLMDFIKNMERNKK